MGCFLSAEALFFDETSDFFGTFAKTVTGKKP